MTFIKDPRSAEVLAALRKEGKVLLEVVCTQLYVLDYRYTSPPEDEALEALCQEWFVEYRGKGHAYRDGAHIGGGDEVSLIKVLTDGKRIIDLRPPPMPLPCTVFPRSETNLPERLP